MVENITYQKKVTFFQSTLFAIKNYRSGWKKKYDRSISCYLKPITYCNDDVWNISLFGKNLRNTKKIEYSQYMFFRERMNIIIT